MAMSAEELAKAEESLGWGLPALYRDLLLQYGTGSLGQACEVYHPGSIAELYRPFFDNPEHLFSVYFPFGCNNYSQEMWVVDTKRELAASIHHETVPDDWAEEEWLSFETWKQRYL